MGEHEGLLDGGQTVKFGDELEDMSSAFGEFVGEDHLDLVVLVEVHVDGAGEVESFVDELVVLSVGAALGDGEGVAEDVVVDERGGDSAVSAREVGEDPEDGVVGVIGDGMLELVLEDIEDAETEEFGDVLVGCGGGEVAEEDEDIVLCSCVADVEVLEKFGAEDGGVEDVVEVLLGLR